MIPTPEPGEPRTLDPEALTRLLAAESDFQAARAELAEAESRRYAQVWAAYLAARRNPQALISETPATITRATLAGAIRRHAEPTDWEQLTLLALEI